MQSTESYFKGDELAISTFNRKYALPKGKGLECPEEAVRRVIRPLLKFESSQKIGETWLETWMNGYWRFGGSIFTVDNKENPKQSTANCTTTIVEDDTLESIFKAAYEVAKCAAYRQGIGIDISALRPRGSKLRNSAKTSDGSIHWLDFISVLANYVGQNARKPALLGSLNILHPDILEFISIKDNLKKLTNMNVSVQIPNTFMAAAMNDRSVSLKFNGKIYKVMKAMDLLKLIAEHAYNFGEPGIQFISLMKQHSMQEAVGFPIVGTNAPVIGKHLVFTDKGAIPIAQLYKQKTANVLVDAKHTENIDRFTYGKTGFAPATFNKYPHQKEYHVKLSNGKSIYCNDAHRWLTENGYVPTKNLTPSHKVLLPSDGVWTAPLTEEDKTSQSYRDGALLGWFVGDGYFWNIPNTNKRGTNGNKLATMPYKGVGLIWCKGEEAVFKLFQEKYKELTGETINYIRDRKTCYSTRTSNLKIHNWVCSYNFDGVHKEHIPNECFTNRLFATGFLSGLFGADGHVEASTYKNYKRGRVTLTTSDRIVAEKTQQLLALFGIYASMKTTKVTHGVPYTTKDGVTHESTYKPYKYDVAFGNRVMLQRFHDRIGLFSPRKQKVLVDVLSTLPNKQPTNLSVNVVSVEPTGKYKTMYCAVVPKIHGLVIEGLMSSNCSEKPLPQNGVCNLCSINLGSMPMDNWQYHLDTLVPDIVRFMDDVTSYELTYNKSPLPEQKRVVTNLREIGVGVTNVHEWLLKHSTPYGSSKGNHMLEEVISYISKLVWVESEKLAQERGSFPAFNSKKLRSSKFYQHMCEEVGEPTGLRFAANMSIAPAGSISLILPGYVSQGIEPAIGFAYWRKTRIENKDYNHYFIFTNPLKQALLQKIDNDYEYNFINDLNYSTLDNDGEIGSVVKNIVRKYGMDKVYKGSHDIAINDKLDLLARIQPWVDAGISTTFNLPKDFPSYTLPTFICNAWQRQIKCLSIYRIGSRDDILTFTPPKKIKKDDLGNRPTEISPAFAPKRPEALPCDIHKPIVKGQKYVVLVGLFHNKPYEVFAGKIDNIDIPTTAKTGAIVKRKSRTYDLHIEMDRIHKVIPDLARTFMNPEHGDLTRSVSRELRHGIPVYFIVDGLKKSDDDVTAFSKVLARVLSKYNGHVPVFAQKQHICPVCHTPLTVEGGCEHCLSCGFSKCG